MEGLQRVLDFEMTSPLLLGIMASGAVALVTNWSLFALLGALPPLTYNILGHAKTISILLIAFMFFGESMVMKRVAGIVTAVIGMVVFSMA
jgi:solute carrier family 35 protein E3